MPVIMDSSRDKEEKLKKREREGIFDQFIQIFLFFVAGLLLVSLLLEFSPILNSFFLERIVDIVEIVKRGDIRSLLSPHYTTIIGFLSILITLFLIILREIFYTIFRR